MKSDISMREPITEKQLMALVQMFTAQEQGPVNEEIGVFIMSRAYLVKYKKGDIIHKAGNICRVMNFLTTGLVRGFIMDSNKELTTWIVVEHELAAPIISYVNQTATIENVQALEDCEMITMDYDDIQELYVKFPEFNRITRRLFEIYYSKAELRALIARFSTAEKKYQFFLENFQELSNRVTQIYIASFLGIDQATLSRIRRQKKKLA